MSMSIVARIAVVLLCSAVLCAGCGELPKSIPTDTPAQGTIHLSIDESFRPVMEEQIRVYESSHPNAHLIAHYKPEAECIRDLISDTANRMVIVTRGLSVKEKQFFIDSLSYKPDWDGLATDAIAIVVHKDNPDTLFTMDELRNRLSGKATQRYPVVFDGLRATSAVRFATDSILKGAAFDTSIVKAVNGSPAVLEYIASDPHAIGLVGISWIGNPEDTAQVKMLTKIKIARVRCDDCPDQPYVYPTQESIMSQHYPLVRALYYILKENFTGLGTGFMNFLRYERGQLIFRRAYLAPGKMSFNVRSVRINERLRKD
jgi:phosphate transport system substrate-binding protein